MTQSPSPSADEKLIAALRDHVQAYFDVNAYRHSKGVTYTAFNAKCDAQAVEYIERLTRERDAALLAKDAACAVIRERCAKAVEDLAQHSADCGSIAAAIRSLPTIVTQQETPLKEAGTVRDEVRERARCALRDKLDHVLCKYGGDKRFCAREVKVSSRPCLCESIADIVLRTLGSAARDEAREKVIEAARGLREAYISLADIGAIAEAHRQLFLADDALRSAESSK